MRQRGRRTSGAETSWNIHTFKAAALRYALNPARAYGLFFRLSTVYRLRIKPTCRNAFTQKLLSDGCAQNGHITVQRERGEPGRRSYGSQCWSRRCRSTGPTQTSRPRRRANKTSKTTLVYWEMQTH